MKNLAFENLMKWGCKDEDVAIYYNKNFSTPEIAKQYKDLDDCFSVLIAANIIDNYDIDDELKKYYEDKIKNNPFTFQQLIDYQGEEHSYTK